MTSLYGNPPLDTLHQRIGQGLRIIEYGVVQLVYMANAIDLIVDDFLEVQPMIITSILLKLVVICLVLKQ